MPMKELLEKYSSFPSPRHDGATLPPLVLCHLLCPSSTFSEAEAVRKRLAFQILHDQKVGFILLTDVVRMANVGMTQRRDGSRLAIEPLAVFSAGEAPAPRGAIIS